ncbi:glycosyltransferase family 17 protein [Schizothecium vesticola]|uniref:Glycosyltransferase family 17 protein n=1 Tax=Schizothecium vesticola TaxID=314040 RepID=A0AA40EVA5_9PEZI|nr:glycosyltransferase family 17 protein [Schizothecium vesticola]
MAVQRWAVRWAILAAFVWMLIYMFRHDHTNLQSQTRYDTCRAHGWAPYTPPTPSAPPRKVYDLVMINTELDWLEIRLNTTWSSVDYFVLVEGARTFTGLPKPLHLRAHLPDLAPYASKIIYHELRNAMFDQVFPSLAGPQAPHADDVLVVADVDEIPRPETLALLRACRFPRRLTLRSRFYYYSFQFRHAGPEWPHPQATYYQGPGRTVRPNDLRMGLGFFLGLWWDRAELADAAWHCSSCFATMGELLTKMKSFSHSGLNREEYRDRRRIAERVREGRDLWDREGEVFERIERNEDVPGFLLENKERFGYVLDRDGRSAGFKDYDGEDV